MSSPQTLWLGRVRRPGRTRHHVVRVWTSGRPPSADDVAEEIPDPFLAARLDAGAPVGTHVDELARTVEPVTAGVRSPIGELEVVAPVRAPKILCVGRNYRAHAAEMGNEVPSEPMLFLKPGSALIGNGQPIRRPAGYERVDMEAELVVVIGGTGRNLDRDQARELILGYSLGVDVSNRDLQRADKQWTRAKGADSFAPLGPWIRVTDRGVEPPGEARIQGRLDGELRQDAPLSDMVFDVPTVLAHASASMTLEPGDLVYTGTPEGVAPLQPGQSIEVSLLGFELGVLRNPVAAG